MDLSLTEIANEEATDKGTRGPTQKWQCHNYTDIYEAYLHPFRNKKINLLEIGLGVKGPNLDIGIAQGRNIEGGASMKMWHRYFKEARLFGIDINPASFLDNNRTTTAVVDQGDPEQLESFVRESGVEKFDVIIDDGSHWPHHQQISLQILFPHLAEGRIIFRRRPIGKWRRGYYARARNLCPEHQKSLAIICTKWRVYRPSFPRGHNSFKKTN